jgi:4-amino-4-deoxy-L-arabinose transferase-like glycosyltransferase
MGARPHDVTRFLGGLCLVALALRLFHLKAVAGILLNEPADVGMDRWLQMHVAQAVARGNWLGGWSASYDSGPAYAYWLGALYWLGGKHWMCPLLVQGLLGSLTPLLTYELGRRVYSQRAGILAAVLTTLYTPTIFYEMLLVKFSLVPVLVTAMLLCAIRARETRATQWLLLSGIALGAFTALRANAALVAPVVVAWFLWPFRGAVQRLRLVLLPCMGMALVLCPLAFRDWCAAQRGLGTSLWGIHFYIGTQPGADGTYAPVPGVREDAVGHVVDARRIAERREGRKLTPNEVSMHWFREGLRFIRDEPLAYLVGQARKTRLAFHGDEHGSFGDDFHDYRSLSRVLRLPLPSFGVICPLGLLGIVITLVRRRPAILPLFIAIYVFSLLPFFITARYRLPIVLPMLVLAGESLCWIEDQIRMRHTLRLSGATVLVVLAAAGTQVLPKDPWILVCLLILGVPAAWALRRDESHRR